MTNQCQHGQLARVCQICEQAAEIAGLRAALELALKHGDGLTASERAMCLRALRGAALGDKNG